MVDDATKRAPSSQLARLAAGFANRPVRLGKLTGVPQLRGYNALLGVRMVRGALPGRLGSVAAPFQLRHMH
jgi:hypothetical protein